MSGTRSSLAFFGLLFSIILILATAELNETDDYPQTCIFDKFDYRLPLQVAPRHYNIVLTQKKDVFVGYSSILLEVLALRFREKLSPGNYTLNIDFEAVSHSTRGFVRTQSLEKPSKSEYITVFEPIGARSLFPCWDQPIFKTTFNISVVHSSKAQVFSNMPHRDETCSSSGKEVEKVPTRTKRTDFYITPVMPTYLVTIAIVKTTTNCTTRNNIEFHHAKNVQNHVKVVLKIANRANGFLNTYTKHKWGNSIMRILSYQNLTSNLVGGGRFAVFRESDLIYKRNLHFPGFKLAMWKKIANQMAQQCIESFVSPMTWSQLWFSRAFATYLGYKIAGKEYGEDVMTQLFVVQVLQPALHNDIEVNVPAIIHDYDPFYSSLIYKKASAMIKMLECIVTEDIMRRALVQYIKKYAYGSATPIDFLNILEEVMLKLPSGHIRPYWEITKIMHVWYSQRRYPIMAVVEPVGGKRINVETLDVRYSQIEPNKWPTPVIFEKKPNIRFVQHLQMSFKNLSRNLNDSFDIHGGGPDHLVIFNVKQFGYYRVYYEYNNWVKISRHLNNKDHTKIHVLNRAQIVDDAYHFLMESKFSYIVFYGLINYLQDETNFIVWHSVMNILHYVSPFFNFAESIQFKKLMLKLTNSVLMKIGYYENPEDDEMLRALRLLLLNWACRHGHVNCREKAYEKLKIHIHGPKNEGTSPLWNDWMYCAGLMHVHNYTLSELLSALRTQNKDIFQYMICVEDVDLLRKEVEMFLLKAEATQNESVRLKKFFRDFVKMHARKPKILEFILSNFNNILPGHMTAVEKITHIYMSVYSKCQLDEVNFTILHIPLLFMRTF
ncbi:PREDICTED: aminopeptidase N-like [Dinoponera quadriceps]|uniref:Aminopeptidase N-like n=1 Tax=Dinoponera quadriceps TaxID=609295 RepID=A0A6P3Y6I9_DINQU|nr:PREDICTED: aminopeptidase N-like [Dinoponera quadriceps]